jgi:hypothetical protein
MKDGGSAFPFWKDGVTGMSLRDWFAGMALQGLIACPITEADTNSDWARRSYELADAMIAEIDK